MPLVSVIIPMLNEEYALSRCLDSVLGQTYADLDVVVVDNGSTDGSVNIAREYAERDKRVRVFEESGGVSMARNRALREAVGEFVQFVDSDDAVDSKMTETLVRDITSEQADIATCGVTSVAEIDGTLHLQGPSHLPLVTGTFSPREWLTHMTRQENRDHFGLCCNKLLRLAAIRNARVDFPAGFGFAEDHVFTLE